VSDVTTELANEASDKAVEIARLKAENDRLRKLAVGMYGMLEMVDKMLGNHDACETPRPLIFGEDKSFKDVMRELGVEVSE
jgi:hypothetical protein